MENNITDLFIRALFAIPFGLGAIILCIKGGKDYSRFLYKDYQGNSKERFKDNLYSNLYMGLGMSCLLIAIMGFQIGISDIKALLGILPVALCMGAFIIPIGILGAYWRSYQLNTLWGGFMPSIRVRYGYAPPELPTQQKVNLSNVKLPPRVTITAAAVALLVFIGVIVIYFLSHAKWNGPAWVGILVLILFASLSSFGVFMTIISASLSRRIQKMKNGETLDD